MKLEVKFIQVCPYCKTKKIKNKTCGQVFCQYKHHIFLMRKKRKTERTCPSRRVIEIIFE